MPAKDKTESGTSTAPPRLGPDDRLGPEQRRAAIERFAAEEFDVVVIGGGATGTGAALDAATRGLSVALRRGARLRRGHLARARAS